MVVHGRQVGAIVGAVDPFDSSEVLVVVEVLRIEEPAEGGANEEKKIRKKMGRAHETALRVSSSLLQLP